VVKKCANFSHGVVFPEGSILEFNGMNSLDEKSIVFSRVVKMEEQNRNKLNDRLFNDI
jgi:hypothetical protein